MYLLRNILIWCLTNLIIVYNEMTGLVDKRRTVDIVDLDFIKAFNSVLLKILLEELVKYGLDEQTVKDWKLTEWPAPEDGDLW